MYNFYNKIDKKKINTKDNLKLNKSINKIYNLNKINNFSHIINLFTSTNMTDYRLNNINQLRKILKKVKFISCNSGIYKAEIRNNKNIYYKNIFIKEISIFPYDNIKLKDDDQDEEILYLKYNYKFNNNATHNIELFISYLVSKLVEEGLSENFPLFYGYNTVNMKKISYQLESIEELNFIKKNKSDKYSIIKNGNYILEEYNKPCLLLYSELLDISLYNYIKNNKILEDEWRCILFQIIAALVVIQKNFNLVHNDLHLSNIMLKYTKKEYLYYEYRNNIYKIKTYNFIIKIIDWGRGNYNFNNYKSLNFVYSSDGDAFKQYIYRKINNKGKNEIINNYCTDLAILGINLLKENRFPKEGILYEMIYSWLNFEKKNKKIYNFSKINIDPFNLYTLISKFSMNCLPRLQLEKKIFEKYRIKYTIINNVCKLD